MLGESESARAVAKYFLCVCGSLTHVLAHCSRPSDWIITALVDDDGRAGDFR